MARRCEISGKGVQAGNNVSHAKNKTRRRFLPNLHKVTLTSDTLGPLHLKISTSVLRSIDKWGSFDRYMNNVSSNMLSIEGRKLKRRILKAVQTTA